ncbi:MAG: gliding motility-associated C-terminal domain-containing protein [Bacteroidota bacterium]|nr:gliding motility-associated C-terminal domain-containing protein [Bacteroidota bacterium]
MTISRTIAIICLCIMLLPHVAGQQQDSIVIQSEIKEVAAPGDELEIPNVFTPNGDQINDYFEVETDGTTVYELSIFTRTGNRIYHSLSPRIFWDGNSLEGKELKEGIYYYVIEEEGGSNPFESAGFMYLYR